MRTAFLSLWLLGACTTDAATGLPVFARAEQQPSGAILTKFDWPSPCTVRVTEWHEKRGTERELRYTAALEPNPDGDGYVLYKRDCQIVLDVNYRSLTDAHRAALAPTFALMKVQPEIEIKTDGRATGMADPDAYLDSATRALREVAESNPSQREHTARTIEFMRHPRTRALMENRALRPWQTWVNAWIELDLEVDETFEIDEDVTLPDGTICPLRFTYRNHGVVEDPAGHVRYSMTSTIPNETLASLGPLAQEVAHDLGMEIAELPATVLENARASRRAEVVIDPKTLKPFWAMTLEEFTVTTDGDTKTARDRRRYRFDWSHAK